MKRIIESGKEVIQKEIKALETFERHIDESFSKAVSAILKCKGKIIITGIGKSGHIGKKISSTLSSLGTPSTFFHSTEMLHGDSGCLEKSDILIAISNSGNTQEVVETARKAKEIGLKVISINSNVESELSKLSDITLCTGNIEEADHIGLAPTSSTTVVLALGDALAVTVSKEKEFSAKSFAFYHPGGALYKKAVRIKS